MKKLLYFLAFSWISYASIAQTPSACFSSRNDISFINNHVSTRGITKGDFDNDGKLDIVTSNFVTGGSTLYRFSFQKGLGTGKFGSPIPNCVSGNSTIDIKSADFNNNGNLDLAFANNNGVYIYHGQGNGSFDSITRLTLAACKYITVGDFNEDGAQDIAAATGTSAQFTLFKGTVGNPTAFTSQVFTITGFISNMETADMNGDGHLDIVSSTTTGVYVSLNNAASLGNFLTSSLVSIGGNSPTDLTLCDIDGDGDIDVVTTNKTTNNISTAFNNGSGTITYGASYATENGPEGIDNADVNLDGKKDIIVANNTSSTVSIFFGGAAGVFTLNQTTQAPGNAKVVITGAFNSDTYPDIVSGQSSSKYINSFIGNATANYMQVDLFDVTGGPNSAFSSDFNGDGKQDVAILSSTGSVKIFTGNGSGNFTAGSLLTTGSTPFYITGSDLDNSGSTDLVVVDSLNDYITVYYGTGSGSFSAGTNYTVGNRPVQAKIGNLNGDALKDIVVTNSGGASFSVLLAASATSFNPAVNYTTNATPYAVVITDYNIDGNNDIVIGCNVSSSTYAKFLNSGTGTFSANGSIGGATTTGNFITQLESADFDGDGDFDIIVGKTNDVSRIYNPAITTGNAGTNLVSIANSTAGSGSGTVTGLKIIDINNDGHLDVIGNFNTSASTVGNLFASVATAYGTNTGYVLTPPTLNFASELDAAGMAWGDYNNDNRTDVIIPNKGSNSFTVHWNTTPIITAGGPTTFCNGNSVTLTSTSASNWYDWSPNNETTQAISATATGSYYVTTSSSWSEWCSSNSNTIAVTATPGPSAPTVTNSGSNTVCEGNTVTLTSSQSTGNQWYKDGVAISGATNQTYVASSAGSYTVTYTNAGCTSPQSTAIVLTFSQTPVITAMGPTTFCTGGSVVLHSSVASNLSWSPGGATTQDITVTTAGTYTATNSTPGCPNLTSNAIVVTVGGALGTPSVTPAGPVTICSGNTVTLTSSSASNNIWSTGATTQSIVVSTSGNYYVHLDNGTCSSANSNTVSVTVNPTPATPTISAGGSTTFCSGGSVVLTSSSSSGNSWTPGGATTQSITVSTSGSYTVTVTSAGCSATSAATVVTVNTTPATPTITASGPTTFCSGGSVTLTAPASTSYLWSTGATTQSIVVTTSGSYTVQVTNASGCQSAASAATVVTVNPTPATPTISAGGPTTFCSGGSVVLTSSSSTGNSWTPGGATTQSITVSTSGSYTVTVTSAGCSATSAATVVTVNTTPSTPTITASGPTTFCSGGSVTLTAPASTSYLWSTGATTQSIIVTTSGSYTVQVTNASGCQSAASAATTVTVNPIPATPTVTAGGPTTFCTGGSVVLTSSATSGNTWSSGATTQSITVTTSGTYTVTQTVSGCTSASSSPVTVTVNTVPATPTITASGPTTFCAGGSVTLTAPSSTSYLWSNGATTQSIVVTSSGSFTVQVTNAAGCQSAASAATTVTVNPIPATPTVTAGGPTTFCTGGSVVLTSSATSGNTWSSGPTTQSITVTTSGTYTVTRTVSGCTSAASSPVIVTVNTIPATPTITASGSTTFCAGGSVTLTAPASTTYLWSTGATTQSIVVSTSGSFTVQVTNAAGCQSAASAATTVTVNPLPATPTITNSGPLNFCLGNSVTLTSSGGPNYLWSPGGQTTQAITVTASGSYTVQVIDANGCMSASSAAKNVNVNPTPATPTITASGATTFCAGGSVTLTSTTQTNYLWSPGGETTQSIVVTSSGTYSVQAVNGAGCQSLPSNTISVTVNALPATPTITASGPTTFCAGGSVTLTAPTSTTYLWSTGATTQSIVVTTSGSYTVQVTNAAGCQSATSTATTVTVNPIPATPTVTVGGPTTFCAGGSVVLTSSATSGNLWSNSATTQSITVTSSGTYTVTQTLLGCTSGTSTAISVIVNPLPTTPTITASGATTFCAGGSVDLTAPAGYTYLWSNGATTQTITVTTSGSYTVQVTDGNSCTSLASAATTVTVNPIPATPVVTAGGPTTFCSGGSVVLTSSATSGNLWSTSATSQAITVNSSGSYTVTETQLGCTSIASAPITVTVNPLPATPVITASGPTIFCIGNSVVLTAPAGFSYLWSTGATTQAITVTSSGSYTVQVIDANGCTSLSSAATNVTVNPLPATPIITASGPTTFCAGGSVTLSAPAGFAYFWSTGATMQSIVVNSTTSNITVQITNANGCTSLPSSSVNVTVNPLPAAPTISAGGPTTFCAGGSVTLSSTSGTTYLWSNGATTQDLTVSTNGSYTAQVTDVNGCLSPISNAIGVTVNPLPATPTITASGPTTFCAGGSVTLIAPAGYTYLWSDGSTTQSIVVAASGSYTVQITDGNGCTSLTSATTTVTVNPIPATPVITAGGPTTFCSGGSVVLTSSATSGNLWSTSATTQAITVSTSGTYTVTETQLGCTSSASNAISVVVNPLPTTPTISAGGPTTFCAGGSVTLTAPAGYTYLWSNGATTQTIAVTTSGSYTVQVTDGNSCTSLASAATTVTVNPLPTTPSITASGPTTFCAGGSVTLTAPAGYTYLWSNGATTQAITVSASGSYSVQVTDGNSCTSLASATTSVTVNPLPATPTITAGGSTTFCAGGSVTLTAPAGYTYLWSNGATTQAIAVSTSGSYSVQVIDGNSCTSLASAATTVTVNPLPTTPTITASSATTFCSGGSVDLTAPAGYTYLWSNGATTQTITVTTSGSYTVQVTDGNSCTSLASAPTTVTVNPIPTTPVVTAGGPTTFCSGGSVVLTSSATSGNLWSNGATTQSITITTSGTYTVTETQLGCTSSASTAITVVVNPLPTTPTISAGGPTTFCAGGSVTLTAPAGYTYLWSNGATTQTITVTASGSYMVQVTDGNSCTSLASSATTVSVNPLPTTPSITASGPTTFCAGGSVTLTAPAGYTYLWSNGATTQAITVSTSGSYTVQVIDGNSCTSLASAATAVTVNPLPAAPTVTASGPTTFCTGGSVVLTSSSGSTYFWSNSSVTQSITVSSSGTYSAQITDVNGCLSPSSNVISVTVNALPATPTITASGPTTFCAGGSVTLIAPSGFSGYNWSNGATTQSIVVTTSGSYTVQVTNSNGCQSAASAVTTVTVNPIPPTPVVTASGATTFCAGNSITLTSSATSGNLWSPGGQTTQSITVSTSGTYSVTQTLLGCTSPSSAPVTITVNPIPAAPTITAGGPTTFCAGGSVNLTSSVSTGNTWSTAQTTQTITVNASGNYTVTQTLLGCTSPASAPINVVVNPYPAVPTITASGPTTFCAGGSVVLTSSSATNNLWSTGATTQSITVTSSSTHVVQVITNGCASGTSAPVTVTVNALPSAPSIVNGPTVAICQGSSVTLTSSATSGNIWSPGGQTTPSISVSTAGTYTVSVVDGNGCQSPQSSPTVVSVNNLPAAPVITANGPTTFCIGGDVTLTSSYSFNNLWSSSSTANSITVSTNGTYSVKHTDANGCVSPWSAPVQVIVNPTPPAPVITASGPTTFCAGGSVTLTSNQTSGNSWSTGAMTQSITVNSTSVISVIYIDGNGCASSSSAPVSVSVLANPPAPSISASGPTTFCQGGTVTLTSSNTSGNSWSSGPVTQSINVTTGGTYTVTYTNSNGCSTTSAPTTVTVIPISNIPSITSSGPTTFCDGGSVVLTSSDPLSTWNTGATSQSITVTTSGSYTVSGNQTGCSSPYSAPIVVTVNPNPSVPTITPSGPTTLCEDQELYLFSSSSGTNTWSTGTIGPVIQATTSGNYYVTASNSFGCTAQSAIVSVVINPLPVVTVDPMNPLCIITAPFVLSNGQPSGGTYSGSGISGNVFYPAQVGVGATLETYTYTDNNGCTASANGVIQVQDCAGIEENEKFFSLYPNPTNGNFQIVSSNAPIDRVVIYDAQGKMVKFEEYNGENNIGFDLTDFATGVYYIEIKSETYIERTPLIINH